MSRRRNNGKPAPVADRKAVAGGWYPLPATPEARKFEVKHPPMSELLKRRPKL